MTMVTMIPNPPTPDDDDDDFGVDDDDDADGEDSNMSKSAHYSRASFSKTGPSCLPALGYTTQSEFC